MRAHRFGRSATRAAVVGSVLALTAGVAACGGDDGGSGGAAGGGGEGGGEVKLGLITKTDTNPFFVKMKEGAQQAAGSSGATVQSFAGK